MNTMQESKVTIRDLAHELGLSVGTVSNALRGNEGQVSKATQTRVLETAHQMGYRYNRAASALRSKRQGAISLHIPNHVRSMSFYMEFMMGVADVAAENDLDLILATSSRNNRSISPVDGALVVDWLPDSKQNKALLSSGIPVVSAGRPPEESLVPHATVAVDYGGHVYEIVSRALQLGASRVAMIAPDAKFQSDWSRSIVRAATTACQEKEVDLTIKEVQVDADMSVWFKTAEQLQSEARPDFMLFGPQRYAGLMQLQHGWGRPGSKIPWIASCAGDSVTEIGAEDITSVDPHPKEFGNRCATELLRIIADRDETRGRQIEQPATTHWAKSWE